MNQEEHNLQVPMYGCKGYIEVILHKDDRLTRSKYLDLFLKNRWADRSMQNTVFKVPTRNSNVKLDDIKLQW